MDLFLEKTLKWLIPNGKTRSKTLRVRLRLCVKLFMIFTIKSDNKFINFTLKVRKFWFFINYYHSFLIDLKFRNNEINPWGIEFVKTYQMVLSKFWSNFFIITRKLDNILINKKVRPIFPEKSECGQISSLTLCDTIMKNKVFIFIGSFVIDKNHCLFLHTQVPKSPRAFHRSRLTLEIMIFFFRSDFDMGREQSENSRYDWFISERSSEL